MIFFTGVVATLAWQSYGDAVTEMISAWSPRCGWQAAQVPLLQTAPVPQPAATLQPAAAPHTASPQGATVPQSTSASPDQPSAVSLDQVTVALDQLKATSLALDSVRQIIDKLATEMTKLQANEKDISDRTAPVQPPAAAPPRKTTTSSRTLPAH